MWSTLNTSRRSLKHLARVARHVASLRSFGSVSNQVRLDRYKCRLFDIYVPLLDFLIIGLVFATNRELLPKISCQKMDSAKVGLTGKITVVCWVAKIF